MNLITKILPIFYADKTTKTHILLHHTAGGNVSGALDTWVKTQNAKVGAHFVIDRDGTITQAIPLENWAYSLGLAKADNWKYKSLWEKGAIAIELVAYGGLTNKSGTWRSWANNVIPPTEIVTLDKPFRQFTTYHEYTDAQMLSLAQLLLHIKSKKNIPIRVGEVHTFFDNKIAHYHNISPDALGDTQTIFTHVNFRSDGKWDCFPSPKLISLLHSIEKKK